MTARASPAAGPRRRDLLILAAIGAVSWVLHLATVLVYELAHPNALVPVIDERSYDRWARAIAGGDWMGREVFFQEPLYPYVLGALYSLFGPSALVARVAQAGLWAAATVLAGLLARRLFGRAAGFTAAALMTVYWPGLLFPALLLKENLLLPILLCLALLLVATRNVEGRAAALRWAGVGVMGGLGALLRGNVLVLLPVLVLWPIARRACCRERVAAALPHAALVLLGVACVLLPVAWRNWHVGGVFALTTSGAGTNVYGGNNLENPYGRATEFSFIRGIPEHEAGDWRREAQRRAGRELDAGEVSAFWMGEALRSVREHPGEHARILWNKLRLSLGAYEVPDNHNLAWDAQYVPLVRGPWPGFGVVGALGLAGLLAWAWLRARRGADGVPCPGGADELAVLFVLYLGTIVLTVTSDRARLPLIVALIPFAAWFVTALPGWVRERAASRLVPALLALGGAVLVVHVPALPAEDVAEDWDERDFNLSVQWIDDSSKSDDGRALAEKLAQKHPRSARVRTLVAEYDHRRGARLMREETEVAQRAGRDLLEDVLRRAQAVADDAGVFPRERFRAQCLAAWTALDLGAFAEAAARFAAARAFDGDAVGLIEGAARAELGLARRDFEAGRAGLEADPADSAGRARAQAAVESALDRLQALAGDGAVPRARRGEARLLAGWIQLWLKRLPNAERHFRAAIDLHRGVDTRIGLASVLLARAELLSPGQERDGVLRECGELLADLGTLAPDSPAAAELRARAAALK